VDRRVPVTSQFAPEIELAPSTMGGYSVNLNGRYIGWVHLSDNSYWKAYLRTSHPLGHFLGRHTLKAAVERIVAEHRTQNPLA
jgi:hypothetical protein